MTSNNNNEDSSSGSGSGITLKEVVDRIDCLQHNVSQLKQVIAHISKCFDRYFSMKEDEKARRRERSY